MQQQPPPPAKPSDTKLLVWLMAAIVATLFGFLCFVSFKVSADESSAVRATFLVLTMLSGLVPLNYLRLRRDRRDAEVAEQRLAAQQAAQLHQQALDAEKRRLLAQLSSAQLREVFSRGLQLSPGIVLTMGEWSNANAAAVERERQAAREALWRELVATYPHDIAQRVFAGEVWQGASVAMVRKALGEPDHVEEKVLKTKTKVSFKYRDKSDQRRNRMVVHFEDGVCVGWEDKG